MPNPARTLTTRDAVVVGLASMLGAGVFGVFGPAADAAGGGLLIAVGIAAAMALCNALSTAQLAVQYPTSGGVYAFGRARLGAWWGYAAGWCFVIGKIASCAAMAMIVAALIAPEGWRAPVATVVVLAVVVVHNLGITRTVRAATILLVVVFAALGTAVWVIWADTSVSFEPAGVAGAGVYGVLQAGGLMFFAFAGYARIATLAEEVRDPARTIPRAMLIALLGVTATYIVVGVSVLAMLGPGELAASQAPVLDAARAAAPGAAPVVIVGASAACVAALLALVSGVSRTSFAMARDSELPRPLSRLSGRHHVPGVAGWVIGLAVIALVWTVDLTFAIGFSSLGVLLYYFIANVAALTQDREHRIAPRFTMVLGAIGCLALVLTLPLASLISGSVLVLTGLVYRAVTSHHRAT